METRVILLDMDEVICDFTGGVCKLWGITREELERNRKDNEWNIEPAMSRVLGIEVTRNLFWDTIHAEGEKFWSELEPLPWIQDVLNLIEHRGIPFHIVTGPSLCATSYNGKVAWIKRYFGRSFDRFAITPHKELFARRGATLIDDREANCIKFVGGYKGESGEDYGYTGGSAIVFPSYGNNYAQCASDPVSFLRQTPLFKGF